MLSRWLTPEKIHVVESVNNWQEAIHLVAAPLMADKCINPEYIDAIFTSHQQQGPYYVLAPGLAMPHARPEQGVLRNGLSLLHINQGISFGTPDNDPVYVVIMLCAISGSEHIAMITQLAELFSDETRLQTLITANTPESIHTLLANCD
ncbi:PTS sugar transporter subunit IIA [Brenneria uluponensis]|uniref:PTS sugar transporter subunit IIA n=1 Tax=Brenneria uluponensis TaxID=3057057 RepID=UPI0028EF6CBC|nr:PTS sugar transporter subunit IIA [Brenneria ulupoensis]